MVWHGKSSSEKGKASMGNRKKPKLDNARKLRGIHFIYPDDGEFKETMKYARKMLEIPMEAAMPCKMRTKERPKKSRETDDETKGSNKIQKNKVCMHRGGS